MRKEETTLWKSWSWNEWRNWAIDLTAAQRTDSLDITHRRTDNRFTSHNQTVNDGVAHSKDPRKCAYHVTFDLDLEHNLDARLPGDHRVHCASLVAIGPFACEKKRFAQKFTDRKTDRRRTPRNCISSFLEWAKNHFQWPDHHTKQNRVETPGSSLVVI